MCDLLNMAVRIHYTRVINVHMGCKLEYHLCIKASLFFFLISLALKPCAPSVKVHIKVSFFQIRGPISVVTLAGLYTNLTLFAQA